MENCMDWMRSCEVPRIAHRFMDVYGRRTGPFIYCCIVVHFSPFSFCAQWRARIPALPRRRAVHLRAHIISISSRERAQCQPAWPPRRLLSPRRRSATGRRTARRPPHIKITVPSAVACTAVRPHRRRRRRRLPRSRGTIPATLSNSISRQRWDIRHKCQHILRHNKCRPILRHKPSSPNSSRRRRTIRARSAA